VSIRSGRLLVAGFTLMLGVAYLWQSLRLDFGTMDQPGPALFPTIVAFLVLGAAVVVVLEELTTGRSAGRPDSPVGDDRRRVLAFFGSVVGFVLLLPVLGQLLATFVFTAAMVRVLGNRSWLVTVLAAGGVSALSYLVFVEALGVPMPEGLLIPDL